MPQVPEQEVAVVAAQSLDQYPGYDKCAIWNESRLEQAKMPQVLIQFYQTCLRRANETWSPTLLLERCGV
jgi:hypothetical protein